jgi:hypothetical protein
MTTPGPAGWYDDPDDPNAKRYWDGQGWTSPLESAAWTTPRRTASSAVMFKAIVAVGLVLIGGFFAYKLVVGRSGGHHVAGNSGGQQISGNSDEDQIKQLVTTWTEDLNNRDLAGLTSLMCRGSASQLPHDIFFDRDRMGAMSSRVTGIKINGNQATATIFTTWSQRQTEEAHFDTYGKENGRWKICHTVNF